MTNRNQRANEKPKYHWTFVQYFDERSGCEGVSGYATGVPTREGVIVASGAYTVDEASAIAETMTKDLKAKKK